MVGAMAAIPGFYNTAIGFGALNRNTTGSRKHGVGAECSDLILRVPTTVRMDGALSLTQREYNRRRPNWRSKQPTDRTTSHGISRGESPHIGDFI